LARNWLIEAAREYHAATRHSFESVRRGGVWLDWANFPRLFKVYPELEPLPLPHELPASGVPALEAIARRRSNAAPFDLPHLAALLYFAAGITRQRQGPGGPYFFRTYACTGALYEIELYVAVPDLPSLAAGLYHFSPADFALRRLRSGDCRGTLAKAAGNDPAVARAAAVVISSGVYWRNAWKYGERTYRHFGWDNGTLLANLLAMANAFGWPARLVLGFVDEAVNRLCDLDEREEVALSLVAVGEAVAAAPQPVPERLHLVTVPYSERQREFPLMRRIHHMSSLSTPQEVERWRRSAMPPTAEKTAADVVLEPPPAASSGPSIEQVILRRGSARRFAREPLPAPVLAAALAAASAPLDADFVQPGALLNELFLTVHAVEGIAAGSYAVTKDGLGLRRLRAGDFREVSRRLALEQELGGDAVADVFFLAALEPILARLGNRGYRAVQLEAGIRGGRIYLASYALGYGATGLTFYDDEVTEFFSPQAAGRQTIFLVAVGSPARRARVEAAQR
jgi:SagB-type dehydrogenase family enzyme